MHGVVRRKDRGDFGVSLVQVEKLEVVKYQVVGEANFPVMETWFRVFTVIKFV